MPRTDVEALNRHQMVRSVVATTYVDRVCNNCNSGTCRSTIKEVKVKEADLYSAFIEVPYTQGAQVRITQCYLQITPYLPLPRKHSPDGASQTEVADI